MKISRFFILLASAHLALPSAAQVKSLTKADAALKSIRSAQSVVQLKAFKPAGITFSAGRLARESAAFAKQYQEANAALQNAKIKRGAPIELTYNAKPAPASATTSVGSATKRKVDLAVKQHQADEVLYNWGEMMAKNKPAAETPQLSSENGNVILTLRTKKAVIQNGPNTGPETVITPVEIGVNADVLKSATEAYSSDMLTSVFQQTPENAAQFIYLRENFIRSQARFEAAADAVHSLLPSKGSWKNWKPSQIRQNQLIRQNYTNSAANLAVDAINLLQFMDLHREIFSSGLQSYAEIMHLHNASGAQIPATFQTFWKGRPAI